MYQIVYRIMYRFTHPGWDTGVTPAEVTQAFAAGDIPAGAALDLGCGTGTNVIYMAQQGREAFGVDYVPRAIALAKEKARQAGLADRTRFFVGDVTQLKRLRLPACAVALDMGCFHGLNSEQQGRYAAGLAAQLVPGGRFMLYAAEPLAEGGVPFGVTSEQVAAVFGARFNLLRTEAGSFRNGTSHWYWMARKP